jgi:hypothetical protein
VARTIPSKNKYLTNKITMEKIRLSKISGDKLIPVVSTKGNRMEKYISGRSDGTVFPETPTVGRSFMVYDETYSFRTSRVTEILSSNTFKTENSVYKWEKLN